MLKGRDLIANSISGTGKSLVYILPAVMFALEEELKISIIRGEGPISLIITPSVFLSFLSIIFCKRELAM